MKKILKNWRHYPGIHCGSVAIRDVCNYYGYEISEQMSFGLGAGLGFYYSVNEDMSPTRSIHVRGPLMETNFFNNFDLQFTDWKQENDDEKAFKELINFIDEGIPVLIQTDIFYLDYYNSSTHFPGHIIVVCGYDDEESIFYLSDTGFEDLQTVSFDALMKARSSKIKPYPLYNNFLDINIVKKKIDFESAIPDAMIKNATMMLQGFETSRGISSVDIIKKWSEDLPNWSKVEDWKWAARFSYQVIAKRGVEGAGFRWFYRDFLKEAKSIYSNIDSGLIDQMNLIGERWNQIALVLRGISELDKPAEEFEKASQMANDIFILEKQFYELVIDSINN